MMFWRSRRASIIAAAILVAGAVSLGWTLKERNGKLRDKHGYAFPDLQNAKSQGEAEDILRTWNLHTHANEEIRASIVHDIAFALFYGSLLALLAYRASVHRPTPWVAYIGRWAAAAGLVAAAGDLGENAVMLSMIGDAAAPSFALMHAFTLVKNTGIVVAAVYIWLSHLDS